MGEQIAEVIAGRVLDRDDGPAAMLETSLEPFSSEVNDVQIALERGAPEHLDRRRADLADRLGLVVEVESHLLARRQRAGYLERDALDRELAVREVTHLDRIVG